MLGLKVRTAAAVGLTLVRPRDTRGTLGWWRDDQTRRVLAADSKMTVPFTPRTKRQRPRPRDLELHLSKPPDSSRGDLFFFFFFF